MFCIFLKRLSFKNLSRSDGIKACCSKYCIRLFLYSERGDGQGQARKTCNVIMTYVMIIVLLGETILFLQAVPQCAVGL